METYGLVGREAVLRELRTGVDDLTRGRGRLMLITGEPGMGKSALMWAAVELAEGTNVRTATAYCVPDGGAPPLWCWTQVLQDLRAAGEDLDPWLVGRLLELGPETESSMSIGADQRFRLHEAIAAALRRAAGGGLTVAIDDLQWADDESVTLLGFLARRLARGPVLLLATCRDAEAGPAYGPLAARADVLGLSALDDAAIAELITRIQGSRPEPAVVAAVHEQAGGNPLFVRELTRLAMGVGGWTTLQSRAGQAVPDRIAGLLRERLARLSESTRRVLAVAALIGRAGSAELLAVVLKESVDAALVAVDEAVMARVLRRGDQGSGWAFLHDLYRSVLTADLPAPRRAELHAAIGEALELRGSAGAQPLPAATLATHFLGAGESCRAKARTYSRRAAAEATARFGHAEAVRHLEQALRLTDATERADRAELILELGVARHRAGDRAGAEAAFRQLTSSVDDPVSLSRAALGLAALEVRSGTPVDDNVAVIRRAIRALEHDAAAPAETGLLALLHAALARELVHADLPGDLGGSADPRPAAESAAERAIDLAERAGDRHAMAMALLARHDAIWRPGTGTARLQVINDLLVAAEAAGDPDLAAEGLLLRSAALIEIGDPDGVSELRRFTERAEHLGHARGHWLAMSRRATLATVTGELDRAGRLAADALEFGREIGVPDAYGCFGTTMVSLGAQGQPSPMDPPPDGDPVARYATLLLAICQPDVDHGPAVRAVPFSVFGIARDLESRAAGALAFARWGSLEQCRDLEHDLAAYTGSQIVIGGCAAFYGPVDYYLGRLAEARGDPALARSRFQSAAEQAGRLGASSWVEQSRAALAAASADRPATGAEWVNEGATWRLNYAGSQIHLPDAKGLRDLAMLIAAPGRELHVFTLLGRDDPAVGADPVLDDEARRQYRRRMAQLQDDIERADRSGDADASDSASRELDAIMRELSTATGLGGRTRRLGDEVERARKTVSARVHDSLDRISVIHPALGAHLSASVTLGARCSYRPIQPVRWLVRGGDSASNS